MCVYIYIYIYIYIGHDGVRLIRRTQSAASALRSVERRTSSAPHPANPAVCFPCTFVVGFVSNCCSLKLSC